MKMNIVNLTPHTLNIHTDKNVLNIEPSGDIARVSASTEYEGEVAGIPVYRTVYGEVQGLPDAIEGTIFVVSGMTQAQTNRADVYAPGELIRDNKGNPIGCKGLKANSQTEVKFSIQEVVDIEQDATRNCGYGSTFMNEVLRNPKNEKQQAVLDYLMKLTPILPLKVGEYVESNGYKMQVTKYERNILTQDSQISLRGPQSGGDYRETTITVRNTHMTTAQIMEKIVGKVESYRKTFA
mgnify:FL=1